MVQSAKITDSGRAAEILDALVATGMLVLSQSERDKINAALTQAQIDPLFAAKAGKAAFDSAVQDLQAEKDKMAGVQVTLADIQPRIDALESGEPVNAIVSDPIGITGAFAIDGALGFDTQTNWQAWRDSTAYSNSILTLTIDEAA